MAEDFIVFVEISGNSLLRKIKKLSSLSETPVVRAILLIILITIIAAILIELFESSQNNAFSTFWDSVWWVIVTITTVGYGDKIPVTPLGKLIGVVVMFIGIALLSVVTATISSILVTRKIKEGKGLQDIKHKDHILLCGWNNQGEHILSTLAKDQQDDSSIVMVNQLPEEEIAEIISHYENLTLKFVRGDFTKENIMNRANAKYAKSAIILPDTSSGVAKPGDERTILATLSLKTINPKIRVYAHILDRDNISHLRKAKADEVFVNDMYTGYLMANYVASPGIPQFIQQLFSGSSGFSLNRKKVPTDLIGLNYMELKNFYSKNFNGILLGLLQMVEPFDLSSLMSDDYSSLDAYIMRKFQEAGRGAKSDEQVKILINPAEDTKLSNTDFYLSIESV